jgi:hypothetical protein
MIKLTILLLLGHYGLLVAEDCPHVDTEGVRLGGYSPSK